MEHDGKCERREVVRAIDAKLRLSMTERAQLMDDLVVELCFCWDRRVSNGTFSHTFEDAVNRTRRGIGIIMEARGLGFAAAWERTTWASRVAQVEKISSDEVPNVIPVDFRNRRRIDR